MAEVISLFRYDSDPPQPYSYVIFATTHAQAVFHISPDIMQLQDHLFVADLTIVQSYWQKMASMQATPVIDCIEATLKQSAPDLEISIACHHPFQGLVFYNHLQTIQANGCYRVDALFSQKIYRNMGWFPWMLAARQLEECFAKAGILQKERKAFNTKIKRLENFVSRMDLKEFHELKEAHFFEIQRRFSGFIGMLWKWTFPQAEKAEEEPTLFNHHHYQRLKGFPWIPFFWDELPGRKNTLEYPIALWEHVEPVLLEDLNQLDHKILQNGHARVVEFSWTITLFDMDFCELKIPFRYPVVYHEEKKLEFPAVLKQFRFAFESLSKIWKDKAKESDFSNCQYVIAWTVAISKVIHVDQKSLLLFEDAHAQAMDLEEIKNLDNKLRSSIQVFRTHETFIGGYDFSQVAIDSKVSETETLGVQELTKLQPFYISAKKEEIAPETIKFKKFLERSSSDWWLGVDENDSLRDYYICQLVNREVVFAFKDYKGNWFKYGV